MLQPAVNIPLGSSYLAYLVHRFDGETALAAAAYNAGPGAVQRYGGIPPYAETQAYVVRILGLAGGGALLSSPGGGGSGGGVMLMRIEGALV